MGVVREKLFEGMDYCVYEGRFKLVNGDVQEKLLRMKAVEYGGDSAVTVAPGEWSLAGKAWLQRATASRFSTIVGDAAGFGRDRPPDESRILGEAYLCEQARP